jgi:hypothetical protein
MTPRERAEKAIVGASDLATNIEQAIIAAEEAKAKEEREACLIIAKNIKETHESLKRDQGAHAAFLIENLIRARSEKGK